LKTKYSLLIIFIIIAGTLFLSSCTKKEEIYTVGICEFADNPSTKDTERGFIDAFTDAGLVIDKDIKFNISNSQGDFPTAGLIATKFVSEEVNMLCALATPCLQACINTDTTIPILFSRVANPFLAGAGNDANDHLPNVTGVATTSPFKESIALIKKMIPEVQTIGTIWTPSELNSEYYMKLQQKAAEEAGLKVIAVPIYSTVEMSEAVLSLVNRGIDCFYQISDNLTSTGLEAEIKIANEEKIPIFCNQTSDVARGAAVGLGWSFYDAGYEAGKLAIQVYHGKKPENMPIQYMTKVRLYINLEAAASQGLIIPAEIVDSADKIFN
jgi:putative tryptophan/tyrosine transport system substrate-binding protein